MYDNSKIATFIECPRKYYFSWVLNIESSMGSIHLDFGSSLHKALEYFYKHYKEDKAKAETGAIEIFRQTIIEKELEPNINKNLDNGFAALELYFAKKEHYELGSIISVEEIISLDDYIGKPDLITFDEKTNTYKIFDHKTSQRLDRNKFSQWRQNRGFQGYHFLIMNRYPGANIETIVNLFHIVSSPDCFKVPIHFSKRQLAEFWEATLYYINQIKECEKRAYWPKAGSSCQLLGCVYQPLCDQNIALERLVVPSLYKKREAWYC